VPTFASLVSLVSLVSCLLSLVSHSHIFFTCLPHASYLSSSLLPPLSIHSDHLALSL
jgi:hypothetical protein